MTSRAVQQALYGIVFVVIVPTLLMVWARVTESAVPLTAIHEPVSGWLTFSFGVMLMGLGMRELIVRGRGLPMNAFPPPEYVRTGIFRWLRNPIYIGFALACAGVAIATGSASGLWLVTPVTCLSMAALVFGFERHDLTRRFGEVALRPPLLSLSRYEGVPSFAERTAVFVWVLVPWLLVYYSVQAMGQPPDAFPTQLAFERTWPVWQWSEVFYAGAYVFIPLTPMLVQGRRELRDFAVRGAVAIVIVGLIWIAIPVVATNRPFEPANMFGRMLAYEQRNSHGVAAFPAFHVLWTLLAADALSGNRHGLSQGAWRWLARTCAVLIVLGCIMTGMHTVIEVAAALALWIPLRNHTAVWSWMRTATERLANSWREWRVGPVRLINHAIFAAAGSGVGLLIAGAAAGRAQLAVIIWVSACVLVGAGLYAQFVEGSTQLLRPFGWYGGVLGAAVALLFAAVMGAPLYSLVAAFAIAAPWIQILGRLRCLVQGCCHGGPASPGVGIAYHHRRSRVTQLAHLAGTPIHATPLYSIAGNLAIGILLLRLRSLGIADTMIIGVYLMLSGIARFVEESFRAEPQTPTVAGLHSYQWLALISLLVGVLATSLSSSSASKGFEAPSVPLLWSAFGVAVVCGFAMGVDFPESNRRFSRLAPAD